MLLLSTVIFLSSQNADDNATIVKGTLDIDEVSQIQLIDTIDYGSEELEGMNSIRGFDMEGGAVYLLDEAKSQVVIINEENTTTLPIPKNQNMIGVLEDILVTKNKEIYVLNSGERVVYKFQRDSDLIETYDLSQLELFFPDSLYESENNEIMLSQNQEQFVSLETMSFIDEENLPFQIQRINRKESKLLLHDEGNQTALTLFSNLGVGNLGVQQLTDEQIVYFQTVNPPVYAPLSETHIFALNREGTTVGGARIPIENFMEVPQRVEKFITMEGNQIYLLIPGKEHTNLYEITLGKKYDSFIEEEVEKVKIGFDYKTFGEPFPELEEELKELFRSGKMEFGNGDSLNGVAINKEGTAVIDFKDFLTGSPASAQVQELSEALYSATFGKFPQIQQIYFQFDGSFSAWCYWLESMEEPWKRQDSDSNAEGSDNEFSLFELSPNEEEVYNKFQQDFNLDHLRGLEPISIAKLYVKAGFDKKYDVQYALYTDREGYIQWSEEEDKKIPESDRGTDQQNIEKFRNIDEGTFLQTSDYEGYIEYESDNSSNAKSGFQMIKNEDGVWQVAFMPIQ